MSASQEELEHAMYIHVECMTELLLRSMMTKGELLQRIEDILNELGY